MNTISLPRLAVCLAAALLPLAQPAGAQQQVLELGAFQLRLDRDSVTGHDRSTAVLGPSRMQVDGRGTLTWACSGPTRGMAVTLNLEPPSNEGERRKLHWYFVGGPADSTWVETVPGEPDWVLPEGAEAKFTLPIPEATRLMLRVRGATPRDQSSFDYDLAGAHSALGRLPCSPIPPLTKAAECTSKPTMVDEPPRLTNRSEFARAVNEGYPPELRAAGVSGTVQVRLCVLPDGIVDPGSIQVMSSSREEFNEPTIRAVRLLRFRPATANGQRVSVWIALPIQW